jgi:hypothetical protein
MARHLSVATVIEKNKVTSSVAFVILLDLRITDPNTREVVETLRIAANDENIIFGLDENGHSAVYQAANFDLQVDQKQNSAPSVSLTARDQTQLIASRLEAYAGGVFSDVVLTVVNTARLDRPAEIQERFSVLTSSVKDYIVTASLGAENPLNIQFPKYKQSRERCAWRFKGYGCGYNGPATTCTYVLDGPGGCREKGNSLNARVLPGLVPMSL